MIFSRLFVCLPQGKLLRDPAPRFGVDHPGAALVILEGSAEEVVTWRARRGEKVEFQADDD